MIDPDKVHEAARLCSGHKVDAYSAINTVAEVANSHSLRLTEEEVSATAEELLAASVA